MILEVAAGVTLGIIGGSAVLWAIARGGRQSLGVMELGVMEIEADEKFRPRSVDPQPIFPSLDVRKVCVVP